MPRKFGLTKKQLIDEVNTEFEYALNRPGDSIDQRTADAWRRFNRDPDAIDAADGESEAVSSDVREVVMGMLPQFSRTLALADNLASFDPVGADDEAAADQETKALNHVFWKMVPDAWIKTKMWMFSGLMEMNAYAEAWWDEKKVVRQEEYEGLTLEKFNELVNQPGWEAVERSELRKNELQEDVFDVTFKIVEDQGKPNWEPFPRSEFRISPDANALSPSSGRMRGRERLMTRSELISMGFQKSQVTKLSPYDFGKESRSSRDSDTEHAQAQTQAEKTAIKRATVHNDKSQELIQVRKAYIEIDYDGDGIAELREIWLAGNEILRWKGGEEANRIVSRDPFHVLCAEPRPGQHFGSSPGVETVHDQDQTTVIQRQMFNNLANANEPKQQIAEYSLAAHTLEQLREPGHTVVVTADDTPINTLAIPFTARESFQMLQYLDAKRRERTGVDANAASLHGEDLKHVQRSVHEDVRDANSMKVEDVARTFCETGFKSLLLHLHELMITHDMRAMRVRTRGEYVDIDPRQWRVRENMTVQVGTGMGSREQQLSFLERTAALQMQAFQDPGLRNLLITPDNLYQTTRKIAKLSQLEPDQHWKDPQGQPAPPPSEKEQELQMQAQALQQAQQQVQQEAERVQKDEMKVGKMMDEARASMDKYNAQLKADREKRQLEERLAEANAKLRAREIEDMFKQQEIDLQKAKSEDERAEIRSRTAMNVANAMATTAQAQKTRVESDAMKEGYDQIAQEVGGDDAEE